MVYYIILNENPFNLEDMDEIKTVAKKSCLQY